MSDADADAAYAAFLDKANKPQTGAAAVSTQDSAAPTVNQQQVAPAALVAATKDVFYSSESDEPFEAVGIPLASGSGLPDEETFLKTTGLSAQPDQVTIHDPIAWDTRGRYKALLEAVREASQGNDVRVYRVQKDATRVEYWMVTATDAGELVGVKVLAVES